MATSRDYQVGIAALAPIIAAAIKANVPSFMQDDVLGSSRVDLQACKLEYSIVSPK